MKFEHQYRTPLYPHREAQLEKKAARREAAKERDQSPEINKVPGGGDIMGGDDSFAAAKARYCVAQLGTQGARNLIGASVATLAMTEQKDNRN